MGAGSIIRQVRKSKGISQTDLAKDIMSRSNLSNFENGLYVPSFDKVVALINKLNLSLEEFTFMNQDADVTAEKYHEKLANAENQGTNEALLELAQEIETHARHDDTYHEPFLLSQYLLHLHRLPAKLSLEEIRLEIKPRLFQNDTWYIYEYRLYNNFFSFSPWMKTRCFTGRSSAK